MRHGPIAVALRSGNVPAIQEKRMKSTAVSHPTSRWFDRGRFTALALVVGVSMAASAAWAQQDPPGRVGRISDTEGKVWLYDDQGNEWTEVGRNQPITTGDRLATDNGAHAELRVGSTVFRLGSGTDIDMQQLDDERVVVGMAGGSLAMRVRSPEKVREVEVVTQEGRFVPSAVGHYRIDRTDNRLDGTSWIGSMRFEGSQNSVDIPAGRRVAVIGESGSRGQASDVERDAFSDWVARDDSSEDTRTASRYVSPEMTGAEDLDRDGDWQEAPEYGAIWYPRTVAVGWAPYRYGRWTWVAPWGWTWVDDARWGFAPSHYGRWVYFRNRWGWTPGAYVARPVYSPALVGWVGGGNVSLSFSIGGPSVGWVPLGPREVYRPVYVVTPVYWRRLNGNAPMRPQVPTGPIMYANRNAPGGVTVVSADVLKRRQPVAPVIVKVNVRQQQEFVTKAQPIAAPLAPAGKPAVGTARVKPTVAVAKPAPRPSNPDRTMSGARDQGANNGTAQDNRGRVEPAGKGNAQAPQAPERTGRDAPKADERPAAPRNQLERAPAERATGEKAPVERAPAERAPLERKPGERSAPNERAPQDRTPPDRTPQERSPQERNQQERNQQERSQQDRVPQDRTTASRDAERVQPAERVAPNERINPNAAGLVGDRRGEAASDNGRVATQPAPAASPRDRSAPREAADRAAPPRSQRAPVQPAERADRSVQPSERVERPVQPAQAPREPVQEPREVVPPQRVQAPVRPPVREDGRPEVRTVQPPARINGDQRADRGNDRRVQQALQ
jgi:hypothetical protein